MEIKLRKRYKFAGDIYPKLVEIGFDDETAQRFLNSIEDADVEETEHASWEYDPNGNDWGLGAWCCSRCGCKNDNLGGDGSIKPAFFAGSKYCPHCGAKMDRKEART